MFDQKPNSAASGAVPATNIRPENIAERGAFLYIEDIFDPDKHPAEDLHKYVVPRENQLVFDVEGGVIHRVTKVDWQATLKSTLVPWRFQNADEGNTSEQDWIFGVRGGPMAGEALLSVDFSVRPNRAQVDSTIMRSGAAYALLYLGNDISSNGRIISAQYDQAVNMLNNKVPVKLAEIVDRTNLSIMTTGSFSVTENEESLENGKRCTLVFFDEGGNFIPPAQPVQVQHSSYMRDHQIGIKYLTEIELRSPWFTATSDKERLLIPINVNLASVEFRAVSHYSDGTFDDEPVNSAKFALHGLGQYRPKYPGQTASVTLVRKLAPDEQRLIAEPGNPDFMSREYVFEAAAVKGAYSPRLFTYPQWDGSIGGYKLLHFLYDLNRRAFINVTEQVTLNDRSPAFRPTSYGVVQDMIFNINLKDVSPTNESVIFTQHTEVTLLKNINGPDTRWSVNYVPDKPTYRALLARARNSGTNTTVNLTNGFANLEAWLNGLYWSVQPSYDQYSEEKAPTPTHFYIMHEDGRRWRFPIAQWNQDNRVEIELQRGRSYFIAWVQRLDSGEELQLALTGVTGELV